MSTTLVSDPVNTGGQRVDWSAPVSEKQGKPPIDEAPGESGGPGGHARDSGVPEDSQDAAGVIQKDGQITKAAPGEPRALYGYLVYKPSSTARVWGGRKNIYHYPGLEALNAVVNRTLDEIRWIQVLSWRNDTSAAQQYQVSYTTGLTITEGSEVNAGFSLGASYEGMSIGFDYSTRTFRSTETTSSKTITVTVNVPAYSELIFYQRRYQFRDLIIFVLDAWGQEWNVGPWGGYTPLTTKHTLVQILAEEYFTTTAPLPAGPGSVQVTTVPQAPGVGVTRKRENTTDRCKRALSNMGL